MTKTYKVLILLLFCLLIITEVVAIENLGQIGECYLNAGYCRETKIIDDYAYVGCQYGLIILDISDDNNPTLVGSYKTPNLCFSLDIQNNYAILACGNDGLIILDISNSHNPTFLSECKLQNPNLDARKVEIHNNYAFVCGGHNNPNLYIIDISNINNPEILAYDDSDYYRHFTVDGNYIYALKNEFFIVDISQITNPTLINIIDLIGSSIAVQDDKAYITSAELTIVDISDPNNLNILGSCDIQTSAKDIVVDDEYAYITGSSNIGLAIIDINDSSNPILVQEIDYEGICISKQNNNVYISRIVDNYQTYNGIGIIDVENPNNVNIVSEFKTCKTNKFIVNDNYAYVANGFSGLSVLDITNPSHPVMISTFESDNKAIDVNIYSNIAFLTVSNQNYYLGLQILDISNPLQPTLINTLDFAGEHLSFEKYDNYIYIGGDTGLIKIYDITNISDPILVNQFSAYDWSCDLKSFSNYLFIAGYWGGLQIFDLSNPENPIEVVTYPLYLALVVEVAENIAFIGDSYSSLRIFDTSTLSNPILTEKYSIGFVKDIYCLNDTLYVASSTGIHLFDVTNPYSTYESDTISDCHPIGVFPTQDYLYCTESFQFNIYGDSTLVSVDDYSIINNLNKCNLSNHPNPFNPSTTLRFSLPKDCDVELSIYNIKGQKVSTVANEFLEKGTHTVVWNGTDTNNKTVSSGIYFYKLNVNNKTEAVKKCLLLK